MSFFVVMIDKNKVKDFFNALAKHWDEDTIIDDKIIDVIFTNARIEKGNCVLDVACGTGVLIPYYFDAGVSFVTAIDLSPEMVRIASEKYHSEKTKFICGDATIHRFTKKYDNVVIYNAFPHFGDPYKLIANLSSCLKQGGYFTIAHSMSREKINMHHENIDTDLFVDLPTIDELSIMVGKHLRVTTTVSDEKMYQIVAEKC